MIDVYNYLAWLGKKESSNDYAAKNSIGALGKYQFMPATLNTLQTKYNLTKWISATNFLSNPALQELYALYHVKNSLTQIENAGLSQYIGKTITGGKRLRDVTAKINIYGLLAGIHLGGLGGLTDLLLKGKDRNDGDYAVSDYVAYFSKNLDVKTDLNYLKLVLAIIPAIVLYYT